MISFINTDFFYNLFSFLVYYELYYELNEINE